MPDPEPNLTDMATDSPEWRAAVARALNERVDSHEARIGLLERRMGWLERKHEQQQEAKR